MVHRDASFSFKSPQELSGKQYITNTRFDTNPEMSKKDKEKMEKRAARDEAAARAALAAHQARALEAQKGGKPIILRNAGALLAPGASQLLVHYLSRRVTRGVLNS